VNATTSLLIDVLVDELPEVSGALVSSADGFVLGARLEPGADSASIAAMSAATLGLAGRLVQLVGEQPARFVRHVSDNGSVFVFAIGQEATLLVIADADADPERVVAACDEIVVALRREY